MYTSLPWPGHSCDCLGWIQARPENNRGQLSTVWKRPTATARWPDIGFVALLIYSNANVLAGGGEVCGEATLTIYQGKPRKNVSLLSTMHQTVSKDNGPKKMPETVSHYNSTKYGVDVMDQMARLYSVKGGLQSMHTFCTNSAWASTWPGRDLFWSLWNSCVRLIEWPGLCHQGQHQ